MAKFKLLFFGLVFSLVEVVILAVSSTQLVPPDVRRRIVADEVVVVEVVKSCSSIARNQMHRVEEWNIITTVDIDCFHQPDCDP